MRSAAGKTSFRHGWELLYVLLVFGLVRGLTVSALQGILVWAEPGLPSSLSDALFVRGEAGTLLAFSGNGSAVLSAAAFAVGVLPVFPRARFWIGRGEKPGKASPGKRLKSLLLAFAVLGAVLGLNLLFELLHASAVSEGYQQVAAKQYSADFLVGLVSYCLVSPVAEELVFRGSVYNILRDCLEVKRAALLGAFLFGLYHGNWIQGIYGFLMGLLIIYGYEAFGSFRVPLLIHIEANLVAYCLTWMGSAGDGLANWPVCLCMLALVAGALAGLERERRKQ